MLTENMDILHIMAKALMKYETIDTSQIDEIMQGKEPSPPEGWEDDDTSSKSTPKSEDKKPETKNDNVGDEAPSV